MAHANEHTDRYTPADINGGWPIAGGVVLLAILCIVSVSIIHKKTYKHPTDPSWHARGSVAAER